MRATEVWLKLLAYHSDSILLHDPVTCSCYLIVLLDHVTCSWVADQFMELTFPPHDRIYLTVSPFNGQVNASIYIYIYIFLFFLCTDLFVRCMYSTF